MVMQGHMSPRQGTQFTLMCKSDAIPSVGNANYEWKKDGKLLPYIRGKVYVINDLQPMNDDGNYSCATSNILGKGEFGRKTPLKVYCKSQFQKGYWFIEILFAGVNCGQCLQHTMFYCVVSNIF